MIEALETLLAFFAAVALLIFYFRQEGWGDDAAEAARAKELEALRKVLENAAQILNLSPPSAATGTDPRTTDACGGSIRGFPALLGIGRCGHSEAAARVEVLGLPDEVIICPRPRGRQQEDYYAGVAVDSGWAAFDENYCLYAKSQLESDLATFQARARDVSRKLLEFVAENDQPAFDLELRPDQVRLVQSERLPAANAGPPREATAEDLVALWRRLEEIVRIGLERRVLKRQPDDGDGGPYDGLLAVLGRGYSSSG
jgi:hypothetical protein